MLFAAYLAGGIANGVFNSGLTTMMFNGIPNEFQGRAWAGFGLITNVLVLGGTLVGALGALGGEDGARTMMIAAGVLPAAVAVIALTIGIRSTASLDDARPSHR